MANQVYEPEADEQHAPLQDSNTGQNTPAGKSYDPRGHDSAAGDSSDPRGEGPDSLSKNGLQQAESGAGGPSSAALGSGKPASSSGLRNAEESGSSGAGNIGSAGSYGAGEDSLYNPEGDMQGHLVQARNKARGGAKSLAKSASRNKLIAGTAVGGGGMVIALIILLTLIVGGYKIVAFAEHVAAYQFARSTGQMAEDTASINAEKIGLEAIPDSITGSKLYNALKTKYTSAAGKTSDLWSKLDQYRPNKIISNYGDDSTLKFNEGTTRFGTTYIKSVTINSTATNGESTTDLQVKSLNNALKNKLIPGYKFTKNVSYSRDIAPDLIKALKADDIGPITRAGVASSIRQELNISLTAWLVGRFAGKSAAAANAELERESTAAAQGEQLSLFADNGGNAATAAQNNTPPAAKGPSDGINQAGTDVSKAQQQVLFDDAATAAVVANPNQTPPLIAQTLATDVSGTAITGLQGIIGDVLSFVNPVYKWGVPLCLIYDGSIQQSGPTIDQQSNQLERSALWVQSAAAQEKDGSSVNGEAVGATDWKLGNITASNPELRAAGSAVNTTSFASTEASPTGQYTYSVADYLPGGIGTIVDNLSTPICSALTNVWVGVGLGVANIGFQALLAIFTGGSATAAEGGGEVAVDAAMETQLSLFDASNFTVDAASSSPSMMSRIIARAQSSASFAKDFGIQTGKTFALISVATLLAKQLVVAEMGGSHSTLSTDQSYDNAVDCGTNIYANQVEQRQFYGAPLTDQRLGQDNTDNRIQLAAKTSSQSAFNRYLAIGNPDSLLNRAAMASSGYLNSSVLNAPLRIGNALLNPVKSISSMLNPLISRSSFAAGTITSANTYCGNVQFGYTPYEKQLIANDPSYKPLENQQALDASGQEDAISAKYHQCFDGSESIGTMLSNGDIQRDNSGSVLPDSGLCSPRNLGTANNDPAAPGGNGWHDLVFRWRVAQSYNNALDQLTNEQTVSS